MISKRNARLAALAGVLVFVSTIAVLLARQLNWGPTRPAPDFRTFGPETAAVQIYEYTDFACPACRHAALALEEMLRIYGPAIRLSFKHYPLTHIHPWSMTAAAYADCAGEQGKFREYAGLLFEGQGDWGEAKAKPAEFDNFALKLNLDLEKMRACSEAPGTLKRVKLDMAEGELKGVNATPTFFINGKRAVGGGQLLEQAQKFDALLRKNREQK
jgi:protein-disulfide isomerase